VPLDLAALKGTGHLVVAGESGVAASRAAQREAGLSGR
jgi:hypothetical protein